MLTKTKIMDRNAQIMEWRILQRALEQELVARVNAEWFWRMWQTPDVAMCLGRYSD
jgi:hypothetical protein